MHTAAVAREWVSRWIGVGAGAAVPTKSTSLTHGGVLTRQGVGLYTLTFTDVGGAFAGFRGQTHCVATVGPQIWKYVGGTFVGSTKVIQIECWSLVAPALADPPATASTIVELETTFYDNAVSPS
jgi:hypothetical protein